MTHPAFPALTLRAFAPTLRLLVSRPLALAALLALVAPAGRADEPYAFLHDPPQQATEGEALELTGELWGAALLSSATVKWRRLGDQQWRAMLLLPAGGMTVRAKLPGDSIKRPAIEYYVEGTDLLGRRVALHASALEADLVPVAGPGQLLPPEVAASLRPPLVPRDPGAGRPAEAAPAESLRVVEATPVPPPRAAPVPPAAAPGTRRRKAASSHLALYSPEEPATLAARRPQKLSDALGAVTVLGEDQLKALGVRTVAEALRLVPGLDDSRDVLGFHRASARGLRSDAGVLVLYDGHRLNDPYDGRALLEIPVENLERVEVLRGPGSALLGAGALLATVNVVPRRRDGIAVSADGTSLTQGGVHFHGGGQLAGLQLDGDADVAGGTGLTTPIGRDALTDPLRAQGLLAAGQEAGLLDDRTSQIIAGTRVVVPRLGGGELEARVRFLHQRRGVYLGLFDTVGGDLSGGGGADSAVRREILLGDLSWRRPLGEALSLAIALSADQRDEERGAALAPPNATFGATAYPRGVHVRELWTARTLGAELTLDLHPSPRWRAQASLGLRREQLAFYEQAADVTAAGVPLAELRVPDLPLAQRDGALNVRDDLWALAHGELELASTLSLVAGLRADRLSGPAPDDAPVACTGAACALLQRPAWLVLSPRAGLAWRALPALRFQLLYGRGFRAPTLEELSRQALQPAALRGDVTAGNQRLSPPVSDALEAWAEWSDQLSWGRGRLRAGASWAQLQGEVTPVGAGPVLQNAPGRVDALGVELEARVERSRRFFAQVGAAWGQARARDALPDDLLGDVPRLRLSFGAGVPLGPWLNLSALLQASSAREHGAAVFPGASLAAYSIPAAAELSVTLRSEPLFGVAEASVSARNLLGSQLLDDVPRPDRVPGLLPREGRTLAAAVRARF